MIVEKIRWRNAEGCPKETPESSQVEGIIIDEVAVDEENEELFAIEE